MASDYYQILGVEKTASDEDIKKAFRRRARELHPDVNKASDAEERFKEINEAYDILSDSQKRAQYDRFGSVPGAGGGYGGYQNVDFNDIFGGGFGMGDLFSSFFGGGGGRAQVRREGRDMGVGLRLTLEEVATGVAKEIVYDRLAPCEECSGSGAAKGGQNISCPSCSGTGRVVTVQRTFLGDMQSSATCPDCHGVGKIIDNPCPECEGQGRVPDRCHVTVEVPKGIRDGQQLRLTGYGEAGLNGAQAGNLIVTVRVIEHDFFKRDGDSLHTRA
ncbi:MAG: DnaJ domain-containing protein, partial [Actinobacteria bacterium]|nr:DnaJ domain-containing protein [Actinomycetota bacterium]